MGILATSQVLGDQYTSATPSATGSADLISAATNTGGVIITSLGLNVNENGTGAVSSITLSVGGNVLFRCQSDSQGTYGPTGGDGIGGFCNIQIEAGDAVSYTLTEGSNAAGYIYLTWKHV